MCRAYQNFQPVALVLILFLNIILVAAFNAFFFVAVYYIPESPTYLLSKGQVKKAEAVLNMLDIDLSVMATMQNNEDHREDKTIFSKMKKAAIFAGGAYLGHKVSSKIGSKFKKKSWTPKVGHM